MARDFQLSRHDWNRVAWRTVRHTTLAVLASVIISYLMLETFSQGIDLPGISVAVAAPLALGGPMIFYMTLRRCELEKAYERLEAAAARDSLTGCLNHGAFVDTVTGALASVGGTLLVVDADHFKSINDRFGHASGDAALKLIAAAIRSSVPSSGIVGRLGGEEFGIFLPASSREEGLSTSEAVRDAVQMITLGSGEECCALSVSIGGAVTAGPADFAELFRIADQRLYRVKDAGRNNCDIVMMSGQSESGVQSESTAGEIKRSA